MECFLNLIVGLRFYHQRFRVGFCCLALGLLFLSASFHATFVAFAASWLRPLTVARCFKISGFDWFDGLMVWWVSVVWYFVLKFLC